VGRIFNDEKICSCYGDLLYVDADNTDKIIRNWKSGSFHQKKFLSGWMPPHPTFFVRRSVYDQFGLFNPALGSSADYEIMIRFLVRHRITTAYIKKVIVKMRTGGISNSSIVARLQANKMDRKAWKINGIKPYPWTLFLKPFRKIGQWIIK
jgi:glycosyltransferase